MQIVFYGAGSCTPLPSSSNVPFRSYTGWYTEIGESSLLFDIGAGVIHKMLLDNKDILRRPTHTFITHFHPDHCSDLIALMQSRGVYNANEQKLQQMILGGPSGLQKFIDQVFYSVDSWSAFKNELDISQLLDLKEAKEGVVFENKEFKVSSSPIKHFEDSVCYKLEANGKTIVYSGDMIYDETISNFGKNADLAILECSYPDRKTLKWSHLCPEDIGKLSRLGNFKKVALTHLYPPCHGREDEMIQTIRSIHDVEVIIAEDMMKIAL